MSEKKVKVLILGGGNGAQVLAGLATGYGKVEPHVLTLFADEAERWSKLVEEQEMVITCKDPDGTFQVKGKPPMITKDPAVAVPDTDVAVFVVPAFAHEQYLHALKPYIKPGMAIVGAPGQPGFEFEVRHVLGDKAKDCIIISFETLPWACRMTQFGRSAEVLGRKESIIGAIDTISLKASGRDPIPMVQAAIGKYPVLKISGHTLGITLYSINSYLHPSILYGKWHAWDGKPVSEVPEFYTGVDEAAAKVLSDVSTEVVNVAKEIMKQRPEVDLSVVKHVYDFYMTVWANEIVDKSTLCTSLRTHKAYAGLKHPMKKTEDGKFVPDFGHRYLTEDIPCGLLVTRGIAEIVGVPTPNMDLVLNWIQGVMGKEYLRGGKVAGKDVGQTRAPQRFGLKTLNDLLGIH